jgi:hypothetical protein
MNYIQCKKNMCIPLSTVVNKLLVGYIMIGMLLTLDKRMELIELGCRLVQNAI